MITYDPGHVYNDECPHCHNTTSYQGSDFMDEWYADNGDGMIRVCTACLHHFLAPLPFTPGPRELEERALMEVMRANPRSPLTETFLNAHRKNKANNSFVRELLALRGEQ